MHNSRICIIKGCLITSSTVYRHHPRSNDEHAHNERLIAYFPTRSRVRVRSQLRIKHGYGMHFGRGTGKAIVSSGGDGQVNGTDFGGSNWFVEREAQRKEKNLNHVDKSTKSKAENTYPATFSLFARRLIPNLGLHHCQQRKTGTKVDNKLIPHSYSPQAG